MYLQDPRDSWTPAMQHYFGQHADTTMFDLTPTRLEALVESTRKTVESANKAAAGGKRKR